MQDNRPINLRPIPNNVWTLTELAVKFKDNNPNLVWFLIEKIYIQKVVNHSENFVDPLYSTQPTLWKDLGSTSSAA